jgi:hypothetical protein
MACTTVPTGMLRSGSVVAGLDVGSGAGLEPPPCYQLVLGAMM